MPEWWREYAGCSSYPEIIQLLSQYKTADEFSNELFDKYPTWCLNTIKPTLSDCVKLILDSRQLELFTGDM